MKEKRNDAEQKTEKLNGIMIMNAGFLIYILICFVFVAAGTFYG